MSSASSAFLMISASISFAAVNTVTSSRAMADSLMLVPRRLNREQTLCLTDVRQHLAEAAVEDCHHIVNLLGSHDERRAKSKPVWIETAQETVLQRPAPDLHAKRQLAWEAFLGLRNAHQLDALKESLAANVADDAVLAREPFQAGAEPLALSAGIAA